MKRTVFLLLTVVIIAGLFSGCKFFGEKVETETFKLTVKVEVDDSYLRGLEDEDRETLLEYLGFESLEALSAALVGAVTVGDVAKAYQKDAIARFSVVVDRDVIDEIWRSLEEKGEAWLTLSEDDEIENVDGWYHIYDEVTQEWTSYGIVTMNKDKTVIFLWRFSDDLPT